MSTVEEEKTKQENIKAGKTSCDHIGYFVGFGMEMATDANGVNVITSQNCMMCGEVFVKLITLTSKPMMPIKNKILV